MNYFEPNKIITFCYAFESNIEWDWKFVLISQKNISNVRPNQCGVHKIRRINPRFVHFKIRCEWNIHTCELRTLLFKCSETIVVKMLCLDVWRTVGSFSDNKIVITIQPCGNCLECCVRQVRLTSNLYPSQTWKSQRLKWYQNLM